MLRSLLLWSFVFLLGPASESFGNAEERGRERQGQGLKVCPTPSDTAVVLDTSGSISRPTFEIEKQFVIQLIIDLAGNPNSRQSVYDNDETSRTIMQLEEQPPVEELEDILKRRITHTDGFTYLEAAIQLATGDLTTQKRKHVPLNLVVFTDGHFEDKHIFGYPARAAEEAMEIFVNIFVVAIGEDVNTTELATLTDNPQQIYILNESPIMRILADICLLPLPPPDFFCPQVHDIIFSVDSSGSIEEKGFEIAKNLVRRLLRGTLENKAIRQGLLQYSTEATLIFSPADFNLSGYQKDQLAKTNLTFEDEFSFTENAIALARAELNQLDRGVPRLIVLVSDGKSDYPERAIAEAQQALEESMDIFAVKLGTEESTELEQITDYPERVFALRRDAAGMERLINQLLSAMCPPPPTPPNELPHPCYNPMKVIILMESSQKMGNKKFKDAQQLTRELAKWTRSTVKTRIAVGTYGSDVTPIIGLQEDLTLFKVDSRIRHLKYRPDPEAFMDGAISWSQQQFGFEGEEGANTLILLGSGDSTSRIKDIPRSRKARESGIRIFAVNFGDARGLKHFTYIVGSVSNVWQFQDSSCNRNHITKEMTGEICEVNRTIFNPATPCHLQCDLVVVLDTSRSLNTPNFKMMKKFTSLLLSTFPSVSDSLVGVLTAGTMPRVWLDISRQFRKQIVAAMILGIPFKGGDLDLEGAIRLVRTSFYGGSRRYFVPKTILYLNNEATSFSSRDVAEAYEARHGRINIETIGIGQDVDHMGLQLIAGNETSALFIDTHVRLMQLLEPISQHACLPEWIEKPKTCPKSNDIVFVVDSSSGSGSQNFLHTKEFVARLLPANIGTGRVGMVTYGAGVTEVINLNSQVPVEKMQDAVLTARFSDGEPNAANALRAAMKMLGLDIRCGTREPKASTVVLLAYAVNDVANAVRQTQMIRTQWANTFVLAVGNQLNPYEAERLAGNPEDARLVRDHEELFSSIVGVGQRLCRDPPTLPACCQKSNDVVFVVDGSKGCGKENFEISKDFVARLLPATRATGRVAVITYGSNTNTVIDLSSQGAVMEMQNWVLNAPYSGGDGRVAESLHRAMRMVGLGGDPCERKVGGTSIVLVFHAVEDLDEAIEKSKRFRDQRVNTFVVAVGNQLSRSTVERLAGSSEAVHLVADPRKMIYSTIPVSGALCRNPPTPLCCAEWTPMKYVPPGERSIYTILGTDQYEGKMELVYYCRHKDQDGNVFLGTLAFNEELEQAICYYNDGGTPEEHTGISEVGEVMLHREKKTVPWNGGIIPANGLMGGRTKSGETLYIADHFCKSYNHYLCGYVLESSPKVAHIMDYLAGGNRVREWTHFLVC